MYTYLAEITSVYDGDTCTATIDLGFNFNANAAKLRLLGINTPEMRGVSDQEKQRALAARGFLREKVLNQTVLMKSEKKGKYGRYLVTLWTFDSYGQPEEVSVNQQMIDSGHAVAYMASKK